MLEEARLELQLAGWFDEDSDYGGEVGHAVMELMELFSKQGHSGYSAPLVAGLFKKLVDNQPLTGITGKDEEWGDVSDYGDGRLMYQNKRCSAIFKDGKDGKPYYIDALIKKDQKGICWSGMMSIVTGKQIGRAHV